MKTLLLKSHRSDVNKAGELLKNGGLVGIPTETVYGLAADAGNGAAVAEIFRAKGRPMDNPLIVHISRMTQLEGLISVFPEKARQLAEAFWPGPLTIILPKKAGVPDEVTAGLNTVAVRFPAHPVARAIIEAAGCPLAAPSANSSGKPSPTTAMHVMDDLNGKIAAVVDGGDCGVGVESTVITLATNPPRLLRPGGITPEQLEAVIGPIEIDEAVTHQLAEGQQAASPGMKYKHYSPDADVILIKGSAAQYAAYVNAHKGDDVYAMCFTEDAGLLEVPVMPYGDADHPETQAHLLFECLRKLDEMGAKTVYAHCPAETGVGLAVYNRILRAAGFEVIDCTEEYV
jgi:L-threonylcarbamoyladenylate synthase